MYFNYYSNKPNKTITMTIINNDSHNNNHRIRPNLIVDTSTEEEYIITTTTPHQIQEPQPTPPTHQTLPIPEYCTSRDRVIKLIAVLFISIIGILIILFDWYIEVPYFKVKAVFRFLTTTTYSVVILTSSIDECLCLTTMSLPPQYPQYTNAKIKFCKLVNNVSVIVSYIDIAIVGLYYVNGTASHYKIIYGLVKIFLS